MDGFTWTERPDPPPVEGGDGYCVRNAVCELLGWPEHSAEWESFPEWPLGKDLPRLCEHLGLSIFNISIDEPQQWNELCEKLHHPGIGVFYLHDGQKAHTVFVYNVLALMHHWPTLEGRPRTDLPTLGYGWPLGSEHLRRIPQLLHVIVEERQLPGEIERPRPYLP